MSEPVVRYHPRVQHVRGGPWCAPSVGGIEKGFDTPEAVQELFDALREFDYAYYDSSMFRIVKVTEEVVVEAKFRKED